MTWDNSLFKRRGEWFAALLLFIVCLTVFFTHNVDGDTYMALSGGREVFAGELGRADTWSFTTEGRVWINQSWGTGALFYGLYLLWGLNGLVLMKALFILSLAAALFFCLRERGVGLKFIFFISAYLMLVIHQFIDLRGNSFTLIFTVLVLWSIYRMRRSLKNCWIYLVIMLFWVNLHGGYVMGIGLFGIGALIQVGVLFLQKREGRVRKSLVWAGTGVAALLIVLLLNPFGYKNLQFALLMSGESAWKNILEWSPIWQKAPIGSSWQLLLTVGFIVALAVGNFFQVKKELPARQVLGERYQFDLVMFDALILVITLVMAIRSRRFIPLFTVVSAPLLGVLVKNLVRVLKKRKLEIIFSASLAVCALWVFLNQMKTYWGYDVLDNSGGLFEQINRVNSYYPQDIVNLMNNYNLGGRVFVNWDWEGYMHWRCPQFKLLAGGRAQQVYRAETFQLYRDMLEKPLPGNILAKEGIGVAIILNSKETQKLLFNLRYDPNWVIVFGDGVRFLFMDYRRTATREFIKLLLDDKVIFPSEFTKVFSRACLLSNPNINQDPNLCWTLFMRTNMLIPTSWAYAEMGNLVVGSKEASRQSYQYFFLELKRLETMNIFQKTGMYIIASRSKVAEILITLTENYRLPLDIKGLQSSARKAQDLMNQYLGR